MSGRRDKPEEPQAPRKTTDEMPTLTVCACIRTKMQYVTPEGSWGKPSTTAQFWCLLTMSPVGPDEGPVRPEACQRGRTCFEEDA